MNVTVCTHPARCAGMEAAHAGMAAQLADALAQVQLLKAQLAQANATAAEWQDAYAGAVEGQSFYFQAYSDKCKEVSR